MQKEEIILIISREYRSHFVCSSRDNKMLKASHAAIGKALQKSVKYFQKPFSRVRLFNWTEQKKALSLSILRHGRFSGADNKK